MDVSLLLKSTPLTHCGLVTFTFGLQVKVKVRLNLHGAFQVVSATMMEKQGGARQMPRKSTHQSLAAT